MVSTAILSYATASTAQGKFIQFTLRGREYLVFAPRELHQFHNQILAHFLADRNIPHRWIDDQTLDIQASDFSIMGGGKFRVNTKAKKKCSNCGTTFKPMGALMNAGSRKKLPLPVIRGADSTHESPKFCAQYAP